MCYYFFLFYVLLVLSVSSILCSKNEANKKKQMQTSEERQNCLWRAQTICWHGSIADPIHNFFSLLFLHGCFFSFFLFFLLSSQEPDPASPLPHEPDHPAPEQPDHLSSVAATVADLRVAADQADLWDGGWRDDGCLLLCSKMLLSFSATYSPSLHVSAFPPRLRCRLRPRQGRWWKDQNVEGVCKDMCKGRKNTGWTPMKLAACTLSSYDTKHYRLVWTLSCSCKIVSCLWKAFLKLDLHFWKNFTKHTEAAPNQQG